MTASGEPAAETLPAATLSEAPAEKSARTKFSRPPLADVWTRTDPKYRVRAAVLLAINLVLYSGMCVFTEWLHTARALDFSLESYIAPIRFWGGKSPNLVDFILSPINVQQAPVHGIVLGTLMASLIAVPILVAILYRLPASMPFIAALFVLAHLPWLAFNSILSCLLATLGPLRLNFRFGSVLIALLPTLLYLYMSTRPTMEQLAAYPSPMQKTLLAAPWVLAILSACSISAVVLAIAHVVDYRPGAVSPVLAVLFIAPVGLFFFSVGPDELNYRVLENEFGPRSSRFAPVLASDETERRLWSLIAETIERTPDARLATDFRAIWSEDLNDLRETKGRVVRRMLMNTLADRAAAYEACNAFIADAPDSRYIQNVFFLQASILDTRLDERKLFAPSPRREFYNDFPHVQSEPIWSALRRQFPDSPLSVAAGLRLAQLKLRFGAVSEALDIARSTALYELEPRSPATQPTGMSLLRRRPPESSLQFEPEPYLQECRRLAELIERNQDDPVYGTLPLQSLAALDTHRRRYPEQLLVLLQTYPDSLLTDNVLVAFANAIIDPQERARVLEALLPSLPTAGDGRPEALFGLADLELQSLSAQDPALRRRGLERMRSLVADYPTTTWGNEAAQRIRMLEPRSESGPHGP